MYKQIINILNQFLNYIHIPDTPLNPDAFQGVFVKKLSNQNIIKEKRKINVGNTISTINQTHIDVTGKKGMLFFFEKLNSTTTSVQNIDIDIFDNNFKYLQEIDSPTTRTDTNGNTYFIRLTNQVPQNLLVDDSILHSCAYKKYGHTGNQVQINIPDSKESFTRLQKFAFKNDALVMLKYDYLRYVAILIPFELCNDLYSATNTHGNQNINFVALNPSYNSTLARQIQYDIISKDVISDNIDTIILQNTLKDNTNAGTDIEKLVKTRISQGSFRRLLFLKHHHCNLCNISTTSVLRASHIKEWANSSRKERVDANNGLLLCANHDALFDRHLISFEPNTGNICISASLDTIQRSALNISESMKIAMNDRMKTYMQIHYNKFIEKEIL
ncbi:HNH endonuclease [Anaerostipes hadrus]|nr:HNH endonuclease [Anaerostipes hadrus]